MSIFRVRKVAFINFGLLLIFLASWVSWYIYPLARSITKEFSFEYGFAAAEWEEHVFYGKVSFAAVPRARRNTAARHEQVPCHRLFRGRTAGNTRPESVKRAGRFFQCMKKAASPPVLRARTYAMHRPAHAA